MATSGDRTFLIPKKRMKTEMALNHNEVRLHHHLNSPEYLLILLKTGRKNRPVLRKWMMLINLKRGEILAFEKALKYYFMEKRERAKGGSSNAISIECAPKCVLYT